MSKYFISECRGYFKVHYNNERVGKPLYYTIEEAKEFIEEHKKMRDFNIKQIQKETK